MKSYMTTRTKVIAICATLSAVMTAPITFGSGPNQHTDTGPATITKQTGLLKPEELKARAAAAKQARAERAAERARSFSRTESGERLSSNNRRAADSVLSPGEAGFIPSNAKSGECYAQVIIPEQYDTVTERVLVKEASTRIEIVPAQYEEREVRVMTRAPSKKLEVIPAEYKTVQEKVLVSPPSTRIVEVPAKYNYKEEKVLVNPARTVWKKGENPLSRIDGSTGEIVCLVELPAEYKTVKKQIVVEPATTRVEETEGNYEIIEKTVEATPATTRVIEIPAEYEMRKVQQVVVPEQKRVVPVPAEYKTVTRKIKTAPSKTDWRRILCETNVTPEVIHDIQKALQSRGFDPGPLDGVYGGSTKMALENFQSKNNLPRGSLNYETMEALGVSI